MTTIIKSAVVSGLPAKPQGIVTLYVTLQLGDGPGTVTVLTDTSEYVQIPLVFELDFSKVTMVTIGQQSRTVNAVDRPGVYPNGGRGPNDLIVYTPKYGTSTRTNKYGTEVQVIDNIIPANGVVKGIGNITIPATGYILSGHGTSAEWLNKNATIDAEVILS